MSFRRFFAVFKARNIEFFRDKSSLSWSLFFPILLLTGMAIIFSGDDRPAYKVGLISKNSSVKEKSQGTIDKQIEKVTLDSFLQTRFIDYIDYIDSEQAKEKLSRHAIDLLLDFDTKRYWINDQSANSYLVEKIFSVQLQGFTRLVSTGQQIRYIDWVLPGVLGMNMMFSSLFGVGYVIVRYRKNFVLKRLKATPLSAFEFVTAQLASRFFIVMFMSMVVYSGCNVIFDFYMLGSYVDLAIIAALGTLSLISMGLLVASRSQSEELIGGLLNLTSWPMMMLSGVWFSLEGAPQALQLFAEFLPLTHLVEGARKIITEGANLADISYHVYVLAMMSCLFLFLGAYFFSWNTER